MLFVVSLHKNNRSAIISLLPHSSEDPTSTALKRVTMDRSHSMSGKKDLDWFFANKRWVRTRQRTAVEAAFALRPLPADSKALQILLLAPKRTYKRAHDRNRVKRYLREAIAHTPGFSAIEAAAGSRQIQVLVMLRYQKPLEELTWELALKSMQIIAASIGEKI